MEDIVRPELNLEKWPGIWQPARSNSKVNEIVLERKRVDGISKIEITSNSKYGALTTETQKILYALYKISEEKGHPRRLYFSCSKIAKILGKKWGTIAAEIIYKGLYQLRFTAFVLEDAFYNAVTKGRISIIDTFTVLSVLKITKEKTDGHITTESCYCEFNDYIYNNLVSNYVKPLLLDTFLSFGDDGIAQLLYGHLDLMLSKSDQYKRITKGIFDEIHLVGKDYHKVSVRKRTLERIKPKLTGKQLSSGGVLSINIEKAEKGEDYELIALKKQEPTSENKDDTKQAEISKTDKAKIERLIKALPIEPKRVNDSKGKKLVTNEEAREIIQYFHKKFFNLENVKASIKEQKQAKELIEAYSFETTKYIVDYAHNQAQETNYKIGQFGAVLEYAGRGASEYYKELKNKEAQKKLENCEFCSGLIFVDVIVANEKGIERYDGKLKCPHDLEQLKAKAIEKQKKLRLSNNLTIDFK
jgi:hypothetical protein